MEYIGKLFGKIGNKYFDTGTTSEDYDKLKERIGELETKLNELFDEGFNISTETFNGEFSEWFDDTNKKLYKEYRKEAIAEYLKQKI